MSERERLLALADAIQDLHTDAKRIENSDNDVDLRILWRGKAIAYEVVFGRLQIMLDATPQPKGTEHEKAQDATTEERRAAPDAETPLVHAVPEVDRGRGLVADLRESLWSGLLFGNFDEPIDDAARRVLRVVLSRMESDATPQPEPDHLTEGEKAGISGKTLLGPPTVMCPDCGDGVLDIHGDDVQECPLCRWSSSQKRCTAERGATRCARPQGHKDAHRNGEAMWANDAGLTPLAQKGPADV